MPLPTKASVRVALACVYATRTSRGRRRRALADAHDAAVAALEQRLLVEHLDLEAELLGRGLHRAANAFGFRSFGGVLIRSRARLTSAATATARSAAALCALSRGFAPTIATSPSGLRASLLVVGLVGGEGVRAQQRARRHGLHVLGGRRGQRERRLLDAGEGAGRDARGLAQRLRVVGAVLGGLAEADREHDRGLHAVRRGHLGRLALGAGRAQGLQHGGQLAAEGRVHGFRSRRQARPLGTFGHAYDDGVRAQRCGGGGA